MYRFKTKTIVPYYCNVVFHRIYGSKKMLFPPILCLTVKNSKMSNHFPVLYCVLCTNYIQELPRALFRPIWGLLSKYSRYALISHPFWLPLTKIIPQISQIIFENFKVHFSPQISPLEPK